MALLKSIPTDYGVPATYWRIAKVSDAFHGTVEVTMNGYANGSAADKLAIPLVSIQLWVVGSEETRRDLYDKIKNMSQFLGAEDV